MKPSLSSRTNKSYVHATMCRHFDLSTMTWMSAWSGSRALRDITKKGIIDFMKAVIIEGLNG